MSVGDMFVIPSGPAGEHGANLMEQSGRPLALGAVSALAPTPGARVLEIGFGPGLALEVLTQRISSGSVVGVDPSALMHRRATARNAAAVSSGLIELVHGYVADLSFEEGSFDGALSIDNAHFWPSLRAGLGEIARVLRPGAKLVIAFSPVSGGPPPALLRALTGSGFVDVDVSDTSDGVIYSGSRSAPASSG